MPTELIEAWRRVWRTAAPLLPTDGLEALAKALRDDDPRLLQGATTTPPPLEVVREWPVEAACLLGWCEWKGEADVPVHRVEEAFARMCFDIDHALGQPAGVRWLLNWYDETPRSEMRAALLPEVEREIARRAL
jgi:hypothetical protein